MKRIAFYAFFISFFFLPLPLLLHVHLYVCLPPFLPLLRFPRRRTNTDFLHVDENGDPS